MPLSKLLVTLTSLFIITTTLANTYLIDVRSIQEYNQEHADGAKNIPYDEIDKKINKLTNDKEDKIYLYCRSGRRAEIAADTLRQLGYKHITNLGTLADAEAANIQPTEQQNQ